MERMKNKYDIGGIIARFQVPKLHEAHRKLIDELFENHKKVVILLGVSEALGTKNDPLDYSVRERMIRQLYPTAIVAPILDVHSNAEWSRNVDRLIRTLCPIGSVCLYGGRDSFIRYYQGRFSTFEFESITHESGTQLRKEAGKEILDSEDFRRGIIYANENQYGRVYPTTDMAVVKKIDGVPYAYMGKRKKGMGWRFPGGFIDTTDQNGEQAVKRELGEEFDFEVSDPVYVGSCKIKDRRYPGPDEVIMTFFYTAQYIYGTGRIRDEFEDAGWVKLSPESVASIEEAHLPLFELLLEHFEEPLKKALLETLGKGE